jgi:hypothetical protein
MKGPQLKRMTIVIAVCALIGALAGIAGSAAAPSKSSKKSPTDAQKRQALKRGLFFRAGPGPGPGMKGMLGGPIHSETIVPNQDGTDFLTITSDSGTLLSVDGNTVHLKQGTDKKVYKDDAAIDVGDDPTVIRNHEKAKLSDLKEGDHVHVIVGTPKGNIVFAEDDAFLAQEKKRFKRFERGFRHHGFGPGGPPPMGEGAPAPGAYPGGDEPGGTNS